MFRKGNRPSFLQTPMPLSSMSRTMSITQEPNTLTPVIILYFMLSIPATWIYVIFPLHLRQPISSLNLLVQSNTKKPSRFYSYTTPATPSDRFISTSISSRVPLVHLLHTVFQLHVLESAISAITSHRRNTTPSPLSGFHAQVPGNKLFSLP